MVADKRISIGDRLRYIPMGYFNKNNIGTITGIVTTTLGDVESSAPVALVNMIGGFFNSVVLILFLLLFNWQLGLVALVGVVCYLLVTEAATRKSTSTAEKRQSAQRGLRTPFPGTSRTLVVAGPASRLLAPSLLPARL